MTVDEIQAQFNALQQDLNDIKEEVEKDAHLEFIESLRQYVNKY